MKQLKKKLKKTNFEQYGVLYPMQNTELVSKAIKTKKQNNSYAQSLKKFNATSLEIYNVPFPMQSIIVKNKSRISNLKTKYNKLCNDPEFDILFSFSDYLLNYKNKTYKFKFRCKICNNITYSHTCSIYKDINGNKHLVRCKHCFPTIRCTSKLEIDVFNFCSDICKKFNYKIFKNYRKILQLNSKYLDADIVIPDLKLIIEVDGTYFHSEEFYQTKKSKNIYRKIDKTIIAEKLGYKLIHINEYDWIDNAQNAKIKKFLIQQISSTYIFPSNDILVIDREKHNKNDIPTNFNLIKEIPPILITQKNLHIYNCGFLIYQKIN